MMALGSRSFLMLVTATVLLAVVALADGRKEVATPEAHQNNPAIKALKDHLEKFTKVRDKLEALKDRKFDTDPVKYAMEAFAAIDEVQALGEDWKRIENMRSGEQQGILNWMDKMDPLCLKREKRPAAEEKELICFYNRKAHPYFRYSGIKVEILQADGTAIMLHGVLTEGEADMVSALEIVPDDITDRITRMVGKKNVNQLTVNKITKDGYNGAKKRIFSNTLIIYLETMKFGGVTLNRKGDFDVHPQKGSLYLSAKHLSICPPKEELRIISNFVIELEEIVQTKEQ